LPGAAFGKDVTDLYEEFTQAQDVGHFMQAIHISSFMDPVEFKKKIDESVEYMKSSNKTQNVSEIYVPGELEAICEKKQRSTGIEYPREVIDELSQLSKELNVDIMVS
jgi:LDH2 family malate/lactate/ureidoglycolate dehydrogenase